MRETCSTAIVVGKTYKIEAKEKDFSYINKSNLCMDEKQMLKNKMLSDKTGVGYITVIDVEYGRNRKIYKFITIEGKVGYDTLYDKDYKFFEVTK